MKDVQREMRQFRSTSREGKCKCMEPAKLRLENEGKSFLAPVLSQVFYLYYSKMNTIFQLVTTC